MNIRRDLSCVRAYCVCVRVRVRASVVRTYVRMLKQRLLTV